METNGFKIPLVQYKPKNPTKKVKLLGGNNSDLYRYMARWGKIQGSISNQKDLKKALDSLMPRVRDLRVDNTTAPALTLADIGRLIVLTNSGAVNVEIPNDATLDFPIGTQIDFVGYGTGGYAFTTEAGVNLGSKAGYTMISNQYVGASIFKIEPNGWALLGDLLP